MKRYLNKIASIFSKGHYDARNYWKKRHEQYGLDLRGVGNKGLSPQENAKQYNQGKNVLLKLLNENNIEIKGVDMLDIGCGNGFYAGIYKELGVKSYTGHDITDVLFAKLKEQYPNFNFYVNNIGSQQIVGKFQVITMIDVTQHITDDKKFDFAMQSIKSALIEGGSFIVTSWLSNSKVDTFYEKSRTMEAYKKHFEKARFSEPKAFRDKFIFTIQL